MDSFFSTIGWQNAEQEQVLPIMVRLALALVLSGVVGWERGRRGHNAGLRTHMMVGMGAALFTLIPVLASTDTNLAEVVKGVAAGVGFLGAGTILKDPERQEIEGLTTAASIWMVAALGLAIGAGFYLTGIISVALAWLVLSPVRRLERQIGLDRDSQQPSKP